MMVSSYEKCNRITADGKSGDVRKEVVVAYLKVFPGILSYELTKTTVILG
jgi:hypothetical protein